MEKNINQRLVAADLVCIGTLSLAGCSDTPTNYEGRGNEFQVRGVVHDVEDDGTVHVNENQLVVEAAAGRSADWFKNNEGHNIFSDNFNFEPIYRKKADGWFGDCEQEIQVGNVYKTTGQQIKPQLLRAGMWSR